MTRLLNIKYTEKAARSPESQFHGHQIPVQHQKKPRLQEKQGEKPGYQTYKAAGKLTEKSAITTSGDSGIGRTVAILFTMEGASSLIVYLQEEGRIGDKKGREIVEKLSTPLQCTGGINILVDNVGCQNVLGDINRVDALLYSFAAYQWERTFDTNFIHFSIGVAVAFTRGLFNQQVGKGIQVNCVCPGPIWNPLIPASMTTCAMTNSAFLGQCLHLNCGVVVNG
ncbi:hypothetical protein BDV23DRAFT_176557 [Aspergillus alliaceus]|uniref:NAD(P)-binding protein n=1 Tax=Petromyces alliaceus TaxID=209559 RepID=A0A5N7BTV6_PETAA|nr:hypothetical protein BDV23DRAFT_176557 [Aspergillus alliaceus]